MKYTITLNQEEYDRHPTVKAYNKGEIIECRPEGCDTWVGLTGAAKLPNGQLNFAEWDFRVLTPEFIEFLKVWK